MRQFPWPAFDWRHLPIYRMNPIFSVSCGVPFNTHVRLIYKDEHGEASVSSSVADSTAFWWNPKRPDEPMLWESKIELGEKFFNEIIRHPYCSVRPGR